MHSGIDGAAATGSDRGHHTHTPDNTNLLLSKSGGSRGFTGRTGHTGSGGPESTGNGLLPPSHSGGALPLVPLSSKIGGSRISGRRSTGTVQGTSNRGLGHTKEPDMPASTGNGVPSTTGSSNSGMNHPAPGPSTGTEQAAATSRAGPDDPNHTTRTSQYSATGLIENTAPVLL